MSFKLLRQYGIDWTIEDNTSSSSSLFGTHLRLTLKHQGKEISRTIRPTEPFSFADTLSKVAYAQDYDPVLTQSLKELLGLTSVVRTTEVDISWGFHAALRKLGDSPFSSLAWHALHELDDHTLTLFWTEVEAALQSAFTVPLPSRRKVALACKKALVAFWESQYRIANKSNSFAILSLRVAFEQAPIDEWMWGWLGYLIGDAST